MWGGAETGQRLAELESDTEVETDCETETETVAGFGFVLGYVRVLVIALGFMDARPWFEGPVAIGHPTTSTDTVPMRHVGSQPGPLG